MRRGQDVPHARAARGRVLQEDLEKMMEPECEFHPELAVQAAG